MRKRLHGGGLSTEPLVKKVAGHDAGFPGALKSGAILTDITGKKWKLGKTVGTGAFGKIHLASENIAREVKAGEAKYVAKVEPHCSGPLFVEINCYLRIAKEEMITDWMESRKIDSLGMPHYVASGSHIAGKIKYRFLIIPLYETDLQAVFENRRNKFNLKTVLTIGIQILNTLEYIHANGYIHSDIKASNIGLNLKKNRPRLPVTSPSIRTKSFVRYYGTNPVRSCKVKKRVIPRALRLNSHLLCVSPLPTPTVKQANATDQIYLLDYGLASKYLWSDGGHKGAAEDTRKAHAGTILYCSRDAHRGMQSPRSDLESLGYNMIFWLTSNLPWSDHVAEPEMVKTIKDKCMKNVKEFLYCVFRGQSPKCLLDYFLYLQKLEFEHCPDYDYCRDLFDRALMEYGYKNNNLLDFDNVEGWGRKQKMHKRCSFENGAGPTLFRAPLKSNLPIVPRLRKTSKNNNMKQVALNWSKILMDPECIMKQKRERKTTEPSEVAGAGGILKLKMNELNPTQAMIEVYNNALDRLQNCNGLSPVYRGEHFAHHIEGYTPAMMNVLHCKKEREKMEREAMLPTKVNNPKSRKKKPKMQLKKTKIKETKITPPIKTPFAYSPPRTRRATSAKNAKMEAEKKRLPRKPPLKRSYSLRG